MALDLHNILARVAGRGAMDGEQHLIENLSAIGDAAKLLNARRQVRDSAARAKDVPRDGDGPRPAQPEDRNRALAKRGRNGGDGILCKWRERCPGTP